MSLMDFIRRIERLTPAMVALAATAIATPIASAQTVWYVDDDAPGDPGPGDPTISDPLENGTPEHPFDAIAEGIAAAVNGDTVLVLDGRYAGEGNKNLNYGGKAIIVRSENGPANCIVDCEKNGRGFEFSSGEPPQAVLDGLTIRNGDADSAAGVGVGGGGIACRNNSSPTILNCVVSECSSTNEPGGGIACVSGASPSIRDCVIQACFADRGGGIFFGENSRATVRNCSIRANRAGFGGGIACEEQSDVRVTDCTITENGFSRGSGGGIFVERAAAVFSGCLIADNSSGVGGGASCLLLSRTTFTNCSILRNWALQGSGGGVRCDRPTGLFISNCTFRDNRADTSGGGVRVTLAVITDGVIEIRECRFVGNLARDDGGGIYLSRNDNVTIADCEIDRNVAIAGSGGGIYYVNGTGEIRDCIVSANRSRSSGAGMFAGGDCDVIRCEIVGNVITGDNASGAGIRFGGTLTHCTIRDNQAIGFGCDGGGVSCTGFANIRNCTIIRNTATNDGGGVFSTRGSPWINNCVISDNHADNSGGGVGVRALGGSGLLILGNTILRGNQALQGPQIALVSAEESSSVDVSFSNVDGGEPAVFVGAGTALIWGAGNIDEDPLFVDPGVDFHLRKGSPGIDAGDTNFRPWFGETDLDRQTRVWNGRVDMGVDEFGSFVFGDLNCDGRFDGLDIDAFFLALGNPNSYQAVYPACAVLLADMNSDGRVNGGDIDPFFLCLGGHCP